MAKNIFTSRLKLILTVLAFIIACLIPVFVHSPYYMDLFIIVIVNAVLSISFIMLLRTGLISLGISAIWGIGAYVSPVLVMKLGLSFWAALPASAIITGLASSVLGIILIGSGSSGFTFVILSAVIGMLFTVVVGNISAVGGYNGIPNIPPPNPIHLPFYTIVFDSKVEFFYLALFLLLVILLIVKAFFNAWTGRAWTAIGLSPRLSESIGVSNFRYKLLVFVVSSVIVGLIGSFYAHYEGFVIPDTFGMWQNIYVQAYAILGGVGYVIAGPLLGSAIMTLLPEAMRIANIISPIITGVILILLILFLPKGLLGLSDYWSPLKQKVLQLGKLGSLKKEKVIESSTGAKVGNHDS